MKSSGIASFRAKMVALALLFLVGVGIAAYPFITNAVYQFNANKQIDALDAAVAQGNHEAYAEELERARAYNTKLVGETVPDVFAIREGSTDEAYESFLNVLGDQMMGKVQIPVIRVNLPIYHYSTEESLLKGCGHIFGSSLPVGGRDSHAVITAHRGLPAAKLFTDLDQLELGDRFYITVLDETLAYEVDNIEVVEPTETRSLAIQEGQDLVTLVTCTPYGVNTDRLLVRGHRVPYEGPAELSGVVPHPSALLSLLMQVACVLGGAAIALILRWIYVRARNGGEDPGASWGPRIPRGPVDLDDDGHVGAHAAGAGAKAHVPIVPTYGSLEDEVDAGRAEGKAPSAEVVAPATPASLGLPSVSTNGISEDGLGVEGVGGKTPDAAPTSSAGLHLPNISPDEHVGALGLGAVSPREGLTGRLPVVTDSRAEGFERADDAAGRGTAAGCDDFERSDAFGRGATVSGEKPKLSLPHISAEKGLAADDGRFDG